MRQNVTILAIQSQNNVHKNCWLQVMRELILRADTVKQVRPWTRDLSIQRVHRNCTMVKELVSVSHFLSHVNKHMQGFVSKEPRGKRLENNFANLFGRHLSLQALRLAVVFVGTS